MTNDTEFRPGDSVGPYLLEALIGTGGMGRVFRAVDTRLHRTVAIKVMLPSDVATAANRRRFLQEARAASALNHPNIAAIHDISSQDGIDFLVMEHVAGETLENLIPTEGMAFDMVVKLGSQVASALAAAHAAGIVHRDIKPANIMVTQDQQVKVLDFGVAKMISGALHDPEGPTGSIVEVTIPGAIVGTVSYMSTGTNTRCNRRRTLGHFFARLRLVPGRDGPSPVSWRQHIGHHARDRNLHAGLSWQLASRTAPRVRPVDRGMFGKEPQGTAILGRRGCQGVEAPHIFSRSNGCHSNEPAIDCRHSILPSDAGRGGRVPLHILGGCRDSSPSFHRETARAAYRQRHAIQRHRNRMDPGSPGFKRRFGRGRHHSENGHESPRAGPCPPHE